VSDKIILSESEIFVTVPFVLASSDGYNDNGSGVAALIEVARALVQSACKLK
jgi:Zn-dependent M28 family amino/carboxypeptidase